MYMRKERLSEAEHLLLRALSIDEKALGDGHPNIAVRLGNLAELYRRTNQLKDAERSGRRAVGILESRLGRTHCSTIKALNNLVVILSQAGMAEEANKMRVEILEDDSIPWSPGYTEIGSGLVSPLLQLNRSEGFSAAEGYFPRILSIAERVFGMEHKVVLTILREWGGELYAANRDGEAVTMYRRVLDVTLKLFGDKDQETATAWNCLGGALAATGNIPESEVCYCRTVFLLGKVLQQTKQEPQHLRQAVNNYAQFLRDQGVDMKTITDRIQRLLRGEEVVEVRLKTV